MAQWANRALIDPRVVGSNPIGQLLIYFHSVFPVLTKTLLCRHASLVPRSRIKAFVPNCGVAHPSLRPPWWHVCPNTSFSRTTCSLSRYNVKGELDCFNCKTGVFLRLFSSVFMKESNYNPRFWEKSTRQWGIFNNYKETLSVARVKSVQSALSDLKRPPERLQSQCNYRPFIT